MAPHNHARTVGKTTEPLVKHRNRRCTVFVPATHQQPRVVGGIPKRHGDAVNFDVFGCGGSGVYRGDKAQQPRQEFRAENTLVNFEGESILLGSAFAAHTSTPCFTALHVVLPYTSECRALHQVHREGRRQCQACAGVWHLCRRGNGGGVCAGGGWPHAAALAVHRLCRVRHMSRRRRPDTMCH